MEKTIEQIISEETSVRLSEMEDPDYEFPKQATKLDAFFIAGGILVCLALIILCMAGVIA